MWRLTSYHLIIFVIVTLDNITHAQDGGNTCVHNKRGVSGVCKQLHLCQDAVDDLSLGIYPQNCSLVDNVTIVCCPSETTKTSALATLSTISKSSFGQLPVGEKSKQACEKYKMLAYKEVKSGSSENDIDLIENCPWEHRNIGADFTIGYSEEAEFPHMALIGYGTKSNQYTWLCSGSLISEKFVLTAARCLYSKDYGESKAVRLGDLDYINSDDDQHAQQVNIKSRIEHPLFKFPKTYHDIGLLELENSVQLNLYVKPACLFRWDAKTKIFSGMIAGWGSNIYGNVNSKLLKGANQLFVPQTCYRLYGIDKRVLPRGVDADIQLCFGAKAKNHTDTCEADIGVPIQIYNKDIYCSYYIFGIMSHGKVCGEPDLPSIYLNLYKYLEWIEGIVWP